MPGLPLFCEITIFDSRQYVLSGISFQQEISRKKLSKMDKKTLFFNLAIIGDLIFLFKFSPLDGSHLKSQLDWV